MTSRDPDRTTPKPSRRRFMKVLASLGLIGAGGTFAVSPARSNAYYQGPISDHFDGLRFYNPGGPPPKGLGDLLRWSVLSRAEAWPTALASPHPVQSTPMVPAQTGNRLIFIGHASFYLELAGINVLIDPVFSDRVSPVSFAGPQRANPPGIAFEALPKIDVVLITHNHYDHLDTVTLGRLWQRDRPRIITPLGNDAIIRAAIPGLAAEVGDWGQSFALEGPRGRYRAHLVPTQHWSARGLRDRMHALWASFVLTPEGDTSGPRLYAIGDTGFGDGRTFRHVAETFPSLDLALLPIGAYEPRWFMQDQHMNPSDAVEAFTLCGTKRALGHHWGTFKLTNEGHERPLQHLAEALSAKGIAPERFLPLRPGQVIQL